MTDKYKCRKCGRTKKKLPHERQLKCPYCEIDVLWKTEEWKTFDKFLRGIDIKQIVSPMSSLQQPPFLKTNTVLDNLFKGGIRRGQLIEVYGPFASGKTQFCFTSVVESTGKVLYVDSESTFSADRVMEIARARGKTDEQIKQIDSRLLLSRPKNWKEQMAIFHQLNVDKLDLIIVDSLMVFYREEKDFLGRENLYVRQGLVRIHLANIRNLARETGAVAIITNQVTANPNVTKFTKAYELESGVGGHTVRHIPDVILYFRKAKDPKRIARLMDSSELPNIEVAFLIGTKGIEDIPEEPKKEELEEE